MRRVAAALALVAIAAAALAAGAAAKETSIELSSSPAGLGPGDPWNLGIHVIGDKETLALAGPPQVTVQNGAKPYTRTYTAKPVGTGHADYAVSIRFPEAGTYYYTVKDGVTGRTYEYKPVVISAPEAGAPAGSGGENRPVPIASSGGDGGGFPLWPVLGGTLGAALLAVAAAGRYRRHRPQAAA
ncbi:MAG TPA: hypothetical protein VH306_14350 [Gaiellaceae bacterium]|jgi:hypothetical protein